MLRFCGLLNFLILLSSVPAHPTMGDVDTAISPLSSTAPSVQENATPTDEHVASTSRSSAEELDITMTHAPTSAAAQLGLVTHMNTFASTEPSTTLSNISLSIIGMTSLFKTTTSVMNNKVDATTTHFTHASELSTMVPTTHLITASELSTMVPTTHLLTASEQSTMVPTTHSAPASELRTMASSVEINSIFPPGTLSETKTPMATTTMMTMTTSNQDTEILKPPGDTVSVALPTTTLSPLFSLFGFTSPNDLAAPNDLAGNSDEDTTRMATSTDSKIDGGDKQTASSAGLTEPPKAQATSNELDSSGKSGCNSISTSLALLSLAALYLIV